MRGEILFCLARAGHGRSRPAPTGTIARANSGSFREQADNADVPQVISAFESPALLCVRCGRLNFPVFFLLVFYGESDGPRRKRALFEIHRRHSNGTVRCPSFKLGQSPLYFSFWFADFLL